MTLRAAVLAIATACALCAPPLHAQSGMETAEQLLIPFSAEDWRKWKIGGRAKRPGFTMVEYIPKDQAIENWDRMLTVQIFKAWQAFIHKVQVCDPRVPEHACPQGLERAR